MYDHLTWISIHSSIEPSTTGETRSTAGTKLQALWHTGWNFGVNLVRSTYGYM